MSDEARRSAVTVEIAGDTYTIRSDVSPDYVRECAAYVDKAVEEVRRQVALLEGHKAFILAALALADELFRARGELESLRTGFADLAESLAAEAEAVLGGDEESASQVAPRNTSRKTVAPREST